MPQKFILNVTNLSLLRSIDLLIGVSASYFAVNVNFVLFFADETYKREINTQNPLGTRGRFARAFEETLKALWRGDRPNYSPSLLRDVMAQRNDQFSTYGQQDAQEAMAFIVDSLHEVGDISVDSASCFTDFGVDFHVEGSAD